MVIPWPSPERSEETKTSSVKKQVCIIQKQVNRGIDRGENVRGRETRQNRNRQRWISRHPEERKSQKEEKERAGKLRNTRENNSTDTEKHY